MTDGKKQEKQVTEPIGVTNTRFRSFCICKETNSLPTDWCQNRRENAGIL